MRLEDTHAVCWRSGFETNSKEDDLFVRVLLGKLEGV
jgi:hypothetical protein